MDEPQYVIDNEAAEGLVWEYLLENPQKLTNTISENLLRSGHMALTCLDLSGQATFNSDDALHVLDGHVNNLEWIGITGLDQITDKGFEVFAQAKNLQEIVMFGCKKVSGICFRSLRKGCPKLEYVYHDFPNNPLIEHKERYFREGSTDNEEEEEETKRIVCGRYHQSYCYAPDSSFISMLSFPERDSTERKLF